MRLRTLAATAFFALFSAAAATADVERGRALYESACIGCHGRSVHARTQKSVHSCAELRTTVARFAHTQGRNWDAEDLDDVTAWLNLRYYGFPEEQSRCLASSAARAALR